MVNCKIFLNTLINVLPPTLYNIYCTIHYTIHIIIPVNYSESKGNHTATTLSTYRASLYVFYRVTNVIGAASVSCLI